MPTVYTLTQRWADVDGRRWVLVVRQASSESAPTIENVDLTPDTFVLDTIESGFENLPLGMPTAIMVKYKLDIDILAPNEPDSLDALKRRSVLNSILSGYVFSSNEYHFNIFYLYSDRLNDSLPESEYFVEAITFQRPNVVRTFRLSAIKEILEIDTICAFKVAIENLSMGELYSLYFNLYGSTDVITQGSFNYEYWFGSDRWVRNITPSGGSIDFELKYIDAKLFFKRIIYLICLWVIIKANTGAVTDYEDYIFDDTLCNPFTSITFYTQTQNDDATPSTTTVENPFLLHTIERTDGIGAIVGGFFGEGSAGVSPSSESPFRNYSNAYNFLQDLSEHLCTIVKPIFKRNTLNEIVFQLDFTPIGGGNDLGFFNVMSGGDVVYEQGQDSIKGTKVTSIGRNADDITEYENNLTFSIAESEYNVKEVIFNPQNDVPDEKSVFVSTAYSGGFGRSDKRLVYSNKLFYQTTIASTSAYLKVADKYRIKTDSSNYITVNSDSEILPFSNTFDVQIKLLRRQAQGSLQGAIAKFVTECFKDAGGGYFTLKLFYLDTYNAYCIGDYVAITSEYADKEIDIPTGKAIIVGVKHEPIKLLIELKLYQLRDIGTS